MELTDEENDYVSFMQWFQTTHPDLYTVCWSAITPSSQGKGVTIDEVVLTIESNKSLAKIIVSLVKIIEDFYAAGGK